MPTLIDESIKRVSPWNEVTRLLKQDRSVLVLIPRHCDGNRVFAQLMASVDSPTVKADTRDAASDGPVAQANAFIKTCRRALGSKRRKQVRSVREMRVVIEEELRKDRRRVWFIEGSGFENREFHADVLEMMNEFLGTPDLRSSLQVLAVDDCSAWFQIERRAIRSSLLDQFAVVRWSPFSPEDVRAILTGVEEVIEADEEKVSEAVMAGTGGHPGLVMELVQVLAHGEHIDREAMWTAVRNGNVVAKLYEDFAAAPSDYWAAAARHLRPRIDKKDVGADRLEELGAIVRSRGQAGRQLISGVIREVIESTSGFSLDKVQQDPTELSQLDHRKERYQSLNWKWEELGESDIVALVLSDVHFGDKHAYRIETDGKPVNKEQPRLVDLIIKDLKALGIRDKVNGLAVIGDFTELGSEIEFLRAGGFLEELSTKLALSRDATLLIAGNHDITWDPSPLDQGPNKDTSRRNWQQFLSGRQKITHALASLATIKSPDKTRQLHILGVDSNHVEGPRSGGIGWVSQRAREEAESLVSELGSSELWMTVHHNLLPVTSATLDEAKARHVSLTANSVEVLDMAEEIEACCLIHGHCHQPSVVEMKRWSLDTNSSWPFLVVSAGSVGAKADQLGMIGHNQYYLLVSRRDEIVVVSRRTGEDRKKFVNHSAIRYPR